MDATNQGIPGAGGQLGGEASRAAAVLRLKKQQNTAPKPEASLVQLPGSPAQSATPQKKRL